VRVRTISQRAKDDLVELAVLNERLSGDVSPWEARSRLELLRKKRKNWEHIVNYVTKADAAATLALIEEANEQVGGKQHNQQWTCPPCSPIKYSFTPAQDHFAS
jgi:chlorophyllide a oxygenase